jgi:hypothetical protein
MSNPYSSLPARNFWRKAVSERSAFTLEGLYKKKFAITRQDRIGAAGSCFAQHVGANLRARGFNLLDVEPAPDFFTREEAREQGYGIYSARYGNIYTVRQLLQLIGDAIAGAVRDEDFACKEGRWIDLLRPGVEPAGYDSLEEAKFNRQDHLDRVKELFSSIDVFVFTLGLTEAWLHKDTGTVYPVCPDTLTSEGGGPYVFHNFNFAEIIDDLETVRTKLRQFNPQLRLLFTVSPVPLTATASQHHVLVASTYSKSVLRAVCGTMESRYADADYFPSYEVITSSVSRGVFYDANLRTVNPTGVATAMSEFFAEHDVGGGSVASEKKPAADDEDEVVCEEVMLEAFAR